MLVTIDFLDGSTMTFECIHYSMKAGNLDGVVDTLVLETALKRTKSVGVDGKSLFEYSLPHDEVVIFLSNVKCIYKKALRAGTILGTGEAFAD